MNEPGSLEPPEALNTAYRLLEEQSARIHAEAARQREAFLAEAGEILAGSLDYETTLGAVGAFAVELDAGQGGARPPHDNGRPG